MDAVYVIYKDGERMLPQQGTAKTRVAYLAKGSAKSMITTLINNYIRWELGISELYEHEKWKQEEKKERERYEIVEYVRK